MMTLVHWVVRLALSSFFKVILQLCYVLTDISGLCNCSQMCCEISVMSLLSELKVHPEFPLSVQVLSH